MLKRLLSLTLVMCLVVPSVSFNVYADEIDTVAMNVKIAQDSNNEYNSKDTILTTMQVKTDDGVFLQDPQNCTLVYDNTKVELLTADATQTIHEAKIGFSMPTNHAGFGDDTSALSQVSAGSGITAEVMNGRSDNVAGLSFVQLIATPASRTSYYDTASSGADYTDLVTVRFGLVGTTTMDDISSDTFRYITEADNNENGTDSVWAQSFSANLSTSVSSGMSYSPQAYYYYNGTWDSYDSYTFTGATISGDVVPTPADALTGVSFTDDDNDDTNSIITLPAAGTGNSFVYLVSGSSSAVSTPNAGDDLSSWTIVTNGTSITVDNGKNVGFAEVNSNKEAIKFVNVTAVTEVEIDITAPILSNGTTSNIAQVTATVGFSSDEVGSYKVIVAIDGATVPSDWSSPTTSGSMASGENSVNLTSLTANTAYDVYVLAQDDESTPNVMTTPLKIDLTTLKESLTGTVSIIGTATYGETLTASLTGGSTSGNISYSWNGANSTNNQASYVIVAGDIGNTLTVTATTDEQSGSDTDITSTVAKRTITPTRNDLEISKEYDGNTSAGTVSGNLSAGLGEIVNSDIVSITAIPRVYSDSDVANDKTVVLDLTLSGAKSANYQLTSNTFTVNDAEIEVADYTLDIDATQNVKIGRGLSVIDVLNSGNVAGNISWYSDLSRTATAQDTDFTNANTGDDVTLYYSYTATDSNYVSAAKTGSVVFTIVAKDTQAFADGFDNLSKNYGDSNYTQTTSLSTGNGNITYSSSVPSVATVDSNTGEVTIKGVGSTNIVATASETVDYSSDSNSYILTVGSKELTVNINTYSITKTYDGTVDAGTASGTLTLTGIEGNEDVTVTISTVPTYTGADKGNYNLNATVTLVGTDSANYTLSSNVISVPGIITSKLLSPDVSISTISDKNYTGSSIEPTLAVVDSNISGITIDDDYTVLYNSNTNVGTASATITGIGNYSGTISKDFNIIESDPNVWVDDVTKTFGDAAFNINASNDFGEVMSYSSSDTDVATVANTGIVTIIGAGSTEITVSITGNNNLNDDSNKAMLTINKASQGKPNKPVSTEKTATTITIDTVLGQEYSINESGSSDALIFDVDGSGNSYQFNGLTENTSYDIIARAKGSENYLVSVNSDILAVTTDAKSVSSILITSEPDKVNYITTDNFELAGLEIRVNYDDSSTTIKGKDDVISSVVDGTELTTAGDDQVITITYGGKTAIFTIDVDLRVDAESPIVPNLVDRSGERGDTITLDATSTTSDSGIISYEWYSCDDESKVNKQLEGTNATIDITSVGTCYYYCQVTNDASGVASVNGTDTAIVETDAVKVVITAPALRGTVKIDQMSPKFGDVIVASISNDNSDTNNFSYTWDSVNASNDQSSYTVVEGDIGNALTVTVEADDCINNLTLTTMIVEKADCATTPAAITITTSAAITYNSTTIIPQLGAEYAIGDGAWQDSNVFNSLTPETSYMIKVRIKETNTHKASIAIETLSIETPQAPPNAFLGSVEITGDLVFNGVLTAITNATNELGTLVYQWKADGIDIDGATQMTYTLTENEITKVINCQVRDMDNGNGSRDEFIESNATNVVDKQTLPTPSAPTMQSRSTSSITLTDNQYYEYKLVDGTWQDNNVFSNLTKDTEYTFIQRIKGTLTTYESTESIEASFTTKSSSGSSSSSGNSSKTKIKTDTDKIEEKIDNAKTDENGFKNIELSIDINSVGEGKIELPDNFAGKDINITMDFEDVKVTLSGNMFKGTEKKIEVVTKPVEKNETKFDGIDIFDISIKVDGQEVDFKTDGEISIELKTDKQNRSNHKFVAVYIDDNGNINVLKGSRFDGNNLKFKTNHLSEYGVMYVEKSFNDSLTHWGKEAIEALAVRNVVSGIGDNKFNPDGTITRAEFTTIIVRYFDMTTDSTDNFEDVNSDSWFSDYARIAKSNEILPEFYGSQFEGSEEITREEMMYVLYKSLEISDKLESLDDNGDKLSDFTDSDTVSNYAKIGSEYLIARDVIKGSGNGMFNPTSTSTRAEVVQIIWNMINLTK